MLHVSALVTFLLVIFQFSHAQTSSTHTIQLDSIVGDLDKSFFEYDALGNLTSFESYNYSEGRWSGEEKYIKDFDSQGNLILEEQYEWNSNTRSWSRYPVYRTAYNSSGQITLYTFARYSEVGIWFYESKYEKSYNANGQVLTNQTFRWHAGDESWIPEYDTQFTYENGVKLQSITYRWNGYTESWENSGKTEYLTDVYGNTVGMEYWWDRDNDEWVPETEENKFSYIYDVLINGDSIVIIEELEKVNGTWQFVRITEATYNEKNDIIFFVDSIKGSSTDDWAVRKSKYEYEYDVNDNVLLSTSWGWDDEYQMFIPSGKVLYEYDEMGRRTLSHNYRWYTSINEWRAYQKFEDEYDENGNHIGYTYTLYFDEAKGVEKYQKEFDDDNNIISHIIYSWDYVNLSWVENTKVEYTYEYLYAGDEILKPIAFDDKFYHQAVEHHNYKFENGEWVATGSAIYYYSDNLITGFKDDSFKESVSIYPNPTSDFITIDIHDNEGYIELLDINGVRVLNQKIPQNKTIFVGSLPKGLYLCRLSTEDGLVVSKLLIQ